MLRPKHLSGRWRLFILLASVVALALGIFLISHNTAKAPTTSDSTSDHKTVPAAEPKVVTTKFIFGGDVMLGRGVEEAMIKHGSTWPFEKIAEVVKSADFSIVNLESMLRTDYPMTQHGSLILRGYPAGIEGLKLAGIDGVSLANNHTADMGTKGLQETFDILNSANIKYTGAGSTKAATQVPMIFEKDGVKFGFLNYTYGSNLTKDGIYYQLITDDYAAAIKELKTKVDVVGVLVHFGSEYQAKPNTTQKTFAHGAIDAGATMVIGTHPHVPEPVELYNNGLIVYSLGNLVFDQTPENNKDRSALMNITFTDDKITAAEILPYQIYEYAQPRFYTKEADKQSIYQLFGLTSGTIL